MLVLSRKVLERIHIGDSIVLTVVQVKCGVVRLGIEAPTDVNIAREELVIAEAPASPARRLGD
jgi:carbon storage regulator